MFVPGSKRAAFAQARTIVSCTRSSARLGSFVKEIANALRLGIAARMRSLNWTSVSTKPLLALSLKLLRESDQIIGQRLVPEIRIHRSKGRPDSRLRDRRQRGLSVVRPQPERTSRCFIFVIDQMHGLPRRPRSSCEGAFLKPLAVERVPAAAKNINLC